MDVQSNKSTRHAGDSVDDDPKAESSGMSLLNHVPLHIKHEARHIGHIAEPERTQLWLEMFFYCEPGFKIEVLSLWDAYEEMFGPFHRENPPLDMAEWVFCITVALPFVKEGTAPMVDDAGTVLHYLEGMSFREDTLFADEVMANREKRKLRAAQRRVRRREAEGGDLTQHPLNAFQQHLRMAPLFPLPHDQPGPVTLRIRARAEGRPLGDRVPGFEDVSMKRMSKEWKRKVRERASKEYKRLVGDGKTSLEDT